MFSWLGGKWDEGGNWQLHIKGPTKSGGSGFSAIFSASSGGFGGSLQSGQWPTIYLWPSPTSKDSIHVLIRDSLTDSCRRLIISFNSFCFILIICIYSFPFWGGGWEYIHEAFNRFQLAQRLGVDKSSIVSTSFEYKHSWQPSLSFTRCKRGSKRPSEE